MGLSTKQYEALRSAKIAEARQHGISEKKLDDYEGELFEGEREYLIRMNPPGWKPPSVGLIVLAAGVFGFLITLF